MFFPDNKKAAHNISLQGTITTKIDETFSWLICLNKMDYRHVSGLWQEHMKTGRVKLLSQAVESGYFVHLLELLEIKHIACMYVDPRNRVCLLLDSSTTCSYITAVSQFSLSLQKDRKRKRDEKSTVAMQCFCKLLTACSWFITHDLFIFCKLVQIRWANNPWDPWMTLGKEQRTHNKKYLRFID